NTVETYNLPDDVYGVERELAETSIQVPYAVFAEDLLRDVRRAGFAPTAIATYVRRIGARAVGRLPRHVALVRSAAATALVLVAIASARELPWWVAGLMLGRYALLVAGTFYLYVFRGPVRIQPTAFGKLTGVLTTVLLGLLLLGLASWSDATRGRLKEVF